MATREDLLYVAKIAEQSERFEDMIDSMKKVIQIQPELTVEERNLLSVAYKNNLGGRRSAYRVLESLEKKEGKKENGGHVTFIREYKNKVETELIGICNEIIDLVDKTLIPAAKDAESLVFYKKMKGDYYRYISESSTGDVYTKAGDNAFEAYKAATEKADADLKTTHPIRLGLALNYSVFYYEVKKDPQQACLIAKQAFDNAIGDIDQIE
jgi:14-3-3 protein epsilon